MWASMASSISRILGGSGASGKPWLWIEKKKGKDFSLHLIAAQMNAWKQEQAWLDGKGIALNM